MSWYEVLGLVILISIVLSFIVAEVQDRRRPRGFDTIEGIAPPQVTPLPQITAPPMFHSKYCSARYGSPCNCKGPHA